MTPGTNNRELLVAVHMAGREIRVLVAADNQSVIEHTGQAQCYRRTELKGEIKWLNI